MTLKKNQSNPASTERTKELGHHDFANSNKLMNLGTNNQWLPKPEKEKQSDIMYLLMREHTTWKVVL